MGKYLELNEDELRRVCDPASFPFQTTADLEPLEKIIGQPRAAQAMEFGLKVERQGYNIFVAGITGSGKISYTKAAVEAEAAGKPVPDDWCYVYNFITPGQPKALNLPPGIGNVFRQDMEELVEDLLVEIPKAFEGDDHDKQKATLIKEFQDRSSSLLEELNEMANEQGFALKRTNTGFATIPLVDGKPMSAEDYEKLDLPVREELERKSTDIQLKGLEIMRRIQMAEKETKEKIKELESRIGLFAVGPLFEELKEKYNSYPAVIAHLEAVKENVLEELNVFRGEEEAPAFPWHKRPRESLLTKYKVNLLIDNRDLHGAPVVLEANPSYYNLIGRIEHEHEWGVSVTDFTMIKPGAFHRANGGYLILQVKDVLNYPESWTALKRVLKTGEVRIENMGEQYGLIAMATLKPEPIPIQVKVILIGNPYLYHLLLQYDEDFHKLFKIKADFATDMPRDWENELNLARFISSQCQREKLRHFDAGAVARVVEYSSRLAEDQRKLTTRFNEIVEVLFEADAWAAAEGTPLVMATHVSKAIVEKRKRSNRLEERLLQHFTDGTILLDVTGEVVGQINGLSVLHLGDYQFGKPSRITVSTYPGERGVVHIEREAKMSGQIHTKGVLILGGYLGYKYGVHGPLSLTASVVFEQSYEGVDGDSASSTELYAILSSLAGLPIKQGLAVTGSVNQRGEIQPVGGVTAKVEGFFRVCQLKGLTGEQGVLIPYQNVPNLNLVDEVVEAVRNGQFHIYPVHTVDEGIEILTGVPAGKADARGRYPRNTVHYMVTQALRAYQIRVRGKRSPKKGDSASKQG